MPLDDIANEFTSIEIQPKAEHEPCTIDIKLKNGQKIVRMGISSEAEVLEIFKESGEYATTIFSEFIDEFEGCTVYLGGVVFDRPTTEASIKFTRVKNERSSVFIYGIRLVLDDSKPSNNPTSEQLDYNNIISDFLTLLHPRRNNNLTGKVSSTVVTNSLPIVLKDSGMAEYLKKLVDTNLASPIDGQNDNDSEEKVLESDNRSTKQKISSTNNNHSPDKQSPYYRQIINGNAKNDQLSTLESIIDIKIVEMETRLMQRIDQMEQNTNKTLEEILNKLDALEKLKVI
ncbi:uncharacterized protein LOC107036791 isoform X2 [Diachasma alloeum]|nr:uncharacterized protein LOC107036791 isoform X2 [Diachasma alloeum]